MSLRALLGILFLGSALSNFAQSDSSKSGQRYTISGFVTDKVSGEKLIGANIYETDNYRGSTSNQFGFYSLTLPAGPVKLKISILGYETENMVFDLKSNMTISPTLSVKGDLKTVVVTAKREEEIESKSQMSAVSIPMAQIKSLPKFMGETDILKAIQLLPGVKSGVEGTSGFYVRGGSPDQNLILLDGVPLYNVSHLFGFFSVFNGDAVSNINLLKGGFPARFGGRLSSVLEVNTKDGNKEKLKGKFGIGLISSSVMLEGPAIKDKSTFVISARRTYIDILAQPFIRAQTDGTSAGYYFYDLNGKYTHKLNDRNKVYASFYAGNDKFYVKSKMDDSKTNGGLGWGNLSGVVKLVSQHNDKIFGNYSLCYTRYRFLTELESIDDESVPKEEQNSFFARYYSVINDITAKAEYDYYASPNHLVRFGGLYIRHQFNPGAIAVKDVIEGQTVLDTVTGRNPINADEMNLYAEDDFKISKSIKVNYGLHYSNFNVQNTFYQSLQPRISARYLFNNGMALKASYSRMTQYIHLLSNAGIGLPTDLWVPSTTRLLPERSGQGAVGIAKTLFQDYELTVEGYYKTMSNVIEYKDGESFGGTDRKFDTKVEAGKGWSYGGEFLFQKKEGRTVGWVGYTLSWTNRQFPNLASGKVFPYRYDRRHDVSLVITHKFTENFHFSATFVFGTGNAVTLPIQVGRTSINPFGSSFGPSTSTFNYYGGTRNSFRMAPYHRADVSLSFIKQKKHGVRTWNLSVYNVYNRQNPFYIDMQTNYNTGKSKFVQYSLFPFLPSISYVYEFN